MIRTFLISLSVVILTIMAVAGFRGQFSSKPPLQIFPDMKWQPRYDAQHESDFFADSRAARAPIAGTVPLGYVLPGSYYANSANNNKNASVPGGFSNSTDYFNTGRMGEVYGQGFPVPVTGDLVARGQERFNINCAPCHGQTGAGNGIATQFGLNGVANLQLQRIREMPEGQLFNRITYGFNTMGEYGQQVTVEDRWAIIAYIRALQRSQNAKIADVPDQLRASLDQPQPEAKK
jgi:mono/diheme cytochrome c family protein